MGSVPTEKAYRDYLELYIRYKLKVKAAYAAQLDTLPAQRTELQNFRSQVADTYMKDQESLDRLVKEVYVAGSEGYPPGAYLYRAPEECHPCRYAAGV